MRFITNALVFLFFAGGIGTTLVIILTFAEDLRVIFTSDETEAPRSASGSTSVRPETIEVA
jgi:hypothetical protein